MIRKTPTELFIETARAYWLAIGELANVASTRDDFQRQAQRDYELLEKTLLSRLKEWNGNLEPDEEHVSECRRATSGLRPVGHYPCEIFAATASMTEGQCAPCVAFLKWLAE